MPTLDPEIHDERIRYWNKIYRATLLLLIVIMVGLVGFSAIKINQTTQQTQELIITNQKGSVAARKTLTGYIKCLTLLRFDDPSLLNPNVTKQQVSNALDKCAKTN